MSISSRTVARATAIAEAAGLAALPRLEASFDLTRHGADGLRVVGRVQATVVQNCVVTLEPIESPVDEAVDLVFLPEASGGAADAVGAASGRGARSRRRRCWTACSTSARSPPNS